ncbi:hypothetical protein [Haloechinothrix sp. LS1_15]|uniref:hypothetical protein n=1 Tax=Haloechinothrix sp. LS1_15 TaxID=2652248 RepID=UPI00294845D6|nr:hypothetical protein [Haloechinothrix sp. LS1_15]MDV6014025.1 hypothetical protein [Haloechinothrix sp. LS1_15]
MENPQVAHASMDEHTATDTTTRRADASSRLCAFSGCRAPLPTTEGPGNRPRYCQDGKTWGTKGVSCKQAGHAEEILNSIDSGAVPLALTELSERVTAALDPALQLVDALQRVQQQLESEVTRAERERDEALRTAAEEQGLRAVAEERADEADQRARQAEQTSAAATAAEEQAIGDRDRARQAEQDAERARLRAETQRDSALEQAERSQQRADEAAAQAEELNRSLAAARAEVTGLREQLDSERERATADRQRAEQRAAEFESRIDELRREHQQQLERERERAAVELDRQRAELDRARQEDANRHASEVAELHRRLGDRERQLTDNAERADTARAELVRYRDAVRTVLAEYGAEDGDAPENRVASRLTELVAPLDESPGSQASVPEEHGVSPTGPD